MFYHEIKACVTEVIVSDNFIQYNGYEAIMIRYIKLCILLDTKLKSTKSLEISLFCLYLRIRVQGLKHVFQHLKKYN